MALVADVASPSPPHVQHVLPVEIDGAIAEVGVPFALRIIHKLGGMTLPA
jgi:hypothetical protein